MFSKPLSLAVLLVLVGIAVASVQHSIEKFAENQVPLPQPKVSPQVDNARVAIPFDEGPLQSKFEPFGDLSAIASHEWTTLRHPVLPRYSVRIKESRFCDTTVK